MSAARIISLLVCLVTEGCFVVLSIALEHARGDETAGSHKPDYRLGYPLHPAVCAQIAALLLYNFLETMDLFERTFVAYMD